MPLTIGIDWGDAVHTVCVLDEVGAVRRQFEVSHSADGIAELRNRLAAFGTQCGDATMSCFVCLHGADIVQCKIVATNRLLRYVNATKGSINLTSRSPIRLPFTSGSLDNASSVAPASDPVETERGNRALLPT